THMTTYEFAEEYLFTPLNMTIGSWGLDNQGIYNGGTLLYVTPRAMAKLGLLYLNNGTWDGVEIISEDYVAQSHYPHTEAVFLETHYGYQWWVDPEDGVFSAIGSQGQYIHVIPDYNIVISITANADEPGEDASDAILEYVLSAVLQEGMGPADLLPIFGITTGVLAVTVVMLLYMKRK
ncbi:MAG: serine hydrolase domain-containing protein, partial [Candidatus Thorarchaeota archaeon]